MRRVVRGGGPGGVPPVPRRLCQCSRPAPRPSPPSIPGLKLGSAGVIFPVVTTAMHSRWAHPLGGCYDSFSWVERGRGSDGVHFLPLEVVPPGRCLWEKSGLHCYALKTGPAGRVPQRSLTPTLFLVSSHHRFTGRWRWGYGLRPRVTLAKKAHPAASFPAPGPPLERLALHKWWLWTGLGNKRGGQCFAEGPRTRGWVGGGRGRWYLHSLSSPGGAGRNELR